MRFPIAWLVAVLALPGPASAQQAAPAAGSAADSAADPAAAPMIVLVRHAEKADDDARDPSLDDEGRERARLLADMLGRSGVTAILSTDYRRTRQTAAPLAEAAGVEVEPYDPSRLEALAGELRRRTGLVVVVGHSNTTPELVGHLGGDPGGPIDEEEYDRLYVVRPGPGGSAETLILRFGRAWAGAGADPGA